MQVNVEIDFDINMDAPAQNSGITVKTHTSDQLHRSTETIYSESSEDFHSKCKNAASILQKRKVHSFLDGDGSPYRSVNFFPSRAVSCTRLLKRNSMSSCSQKIMAEKVLQIKQLQNELSEARYQINELANENRVLLNIQKRQAIALRKYEGKKAELPQLMHSHNEEIRVLKSKLKELRAENLEKDQHLKGQHTELLNLKEKHRHLLKLARDRRLKEREQLSKQVEDLQQIIKEQDIKIQTLNRKVMLETKTCKHQLAIEISHHRDTRKALDDALEKIAKLERMLETKEKYIANFSPKRVLPKQYQQRSLSLASWNTKTPRFTAHKTINSSEMDLIGNQNPAIEEESSEATYTASQTATSVGSPGSTNNIQSEREAVMAAEAKYQARRLRLAHKINQIKEKLSDHNDLEPRFHNHQNVKTYFSDEDDDTDTFFDEKTLNSEVEVVSRRTSLESSNARYIDCSDQLQTVEGSHSIQESEQDVENVIQKINKVSTDGNVQSLASGDKEFPDEKCKSVSHVHDESNGYVSDETTSKSNNFENAKAHQLGKNDSLSATDGEEKSASISFEYDQRNENERNAGTEEHHEENYITSIPNDASYVSESTSNQNNTNGRSYTSKQNLERPYTQSRRNSTDDVLPKINLSSKNHEEYLSESATKLNFSTNYASKFKGSLHNLSDIADLSVGEKYAQSSEQKLEKYSSLKSEKEIQNQNHSKILHQDPTKKSKLLAALKAIDDGKDPEVEYDIQTFGIKSENNVFGSNLSAKGNSMLYEMDVKPLSTNENITFPSIAKGGSRRFSTISYWDYHERHGSENKNSTNKDELLRDLFGKHDAESKNKVQSSCSSEGKELLLDVLKPSQNLLEKN